MLSETAVVHTNKTFHGNSAIDFRTTETDAGPTQTIITSSDNYFVFPTGSGNVLNIGFNATDSNGVNIDLQNLPGNGIVGQIPLGASWINSAAELVVENDPDGTITTTAINANGSYGMTRSEIAGTTTIALNSAGSGNEIFPGDPFGLGALVTEFSFRAVTGGTIEVDACIPPGTSLTPCATPAPVTQTIAAWYSASPTLASDATILASASATPPPGCTSSTFAGGGPQLHEVKSRLDPVLGTTDNETIDTWISAANGPVCEKLSDTLALYYDFTGQTGTFTLSSTPIQTITLSELIGLQTVTHDKASYAISRRVSMTAFTAHLAIANERLERFRQAFRTRQLRSISEFMRRGHSMR